MDIFTSIEEEIKVKFKKFSDKYGKRKEGEWEKLFAEILPLLSFYLLHGTENNLKKTLAKLFQMKKLL